MKKKVKLSIAILYQNNYKVKDLDIDDNNNKTDANKNNFVWVKNKYLTFNPLILELFLANLVSLLVKNVFLFKSKKIK